MSERLLRGLVIVISVLLAGVVVAIGLVLVGDDAGDGDAANTTVLFNPDSSDTSSSASEAAEDEDSDIPVVTLAESTATDSVATPVEAWRGRIDIGPGDGVSTPTDPYFSMGVTDDGRFGSQPALSFAGAAEPGLDGCRNHKISALDWPPVGLMAPLVGQYACTHISGGGLGMVVQAHLLEVGLDDSVVFDVVVWIWD